MKEAGKSKVVIIDDGSSINHTWKERLSESGFGVRTFIESDYFLSIIAREEPDLLILGLSLLWLDEESFMKKLKDWLHRIRHIDRFFSLPIVLVSARRLSSDSVQELKFLGVEKILSLPLTFNELVSELRGLSKPPHFNISEDSSYKNVEIEDEIEDTTFP